MTADILLWILVVLLVAIGFAGMVLPALPGAPLLFIGLLLGAWIDDFQYVGFWMLTLLGAMAILTYLVDFAAGSLGAKKFGASNRAVIGAAVGAVVGLFFGLPGILIGPFVGAVIGELSTKRDLGAAGRAGLGATLGLALGVAAKLSLGISMVAIFVFDRFVW